jgi:hypothetical protein
LVVKDVGVPIGDALFVLKKNDCVPLPPKATEIRFEETAICSTVALARGTVCVIRLVLVSRVPWGVIG